MTSLGEIGRVLLGIGLVLLLAGGALMLAGRVGLGKFPGDVVWSRGRFTFYFPIVTCIVISVVLTLLLRLFRR